MAIVTEFVNVSAVLQTAVAPRTSFGIGLFVVDDSQIPVDQRYRYMTPSSKSTWTASTDPKEFGDVFFAQTRTPTKCMIGRWISVATSPYRVCVGYETTISLWAAVTDGSLTVTTAAGSDVLTAITFAGITTQAGIAAAIDAKLIAGGVSGARCAVDALGRIYFYDPAVTGSSGTTMTIAGGGAGTDLYLPAWLNGASSFLQAGLDIEEPTAALTAISALDDSYYEVMCERSLSTAQQTAIASAIESLKKQCTLVYTAVDAKVSGTSTDLGSVVQALSLKRTLTIYTEHTDEWPEAANNGCVLPAVEGTTEFAKEALTLVSESGLAGDGTAKPLTPTEITVLNSKGYCRVATVGTINFVTRGFNASGVEHRIMLGKDWFEDRIQADTFTIMIQNPLSAFDNPTLGQFEGVVRRHKTEAVTRGVLVDTPARPFVLNFPDADDFTQAERATHDMVLSDVFSGFLNSSVVTLAISGTWTI